MFIRVHNEKEMCPTYLEPFNIMMIKLDEYIDMHA